MIETTKSMTPIVKDLVVQISTYGALTSIAVAAIKKALKIILNMKKEEKLNRFIPLILLIVIGIVFGFLVKSPLVTNVILNVLFGVLIGLFALLSYDAVIKSTLQIIPAIMKRIMGTK